MERKIYNTLHNWKLNPQKKPLIIHGARQTGKTYSSIDFGQREYKNTIYLNFEGDTILQKIFDRDYNIDRLIRELSAFKSETILEEDSLIIFDEVQTCEKALNSLKYFCESDKNYHIIACGSLFGVAINRENYSFPVGKVDMINMYPMDFEEFLWALDKKNLSKLIREHFEKNIELSLHANALDLYKEYLCVGGMPSVVSTYIDTKNYDLVKSDLNTLLDSYIADMAKYSTPKDMMKIRASYDSIPLQLAKDNRKFQYKVIGKGARSKDYEFALTWLEHSGMIYKTLKIDSPKLPLNAYIDINSFKIYMSDVGMLRAKANIPFKAVINDSVLFNDFKGWLTENYVACNLSKSGFELYYWESDGKAEIDFLIQDKEGNIIPIEVKSSVNNKSKSLNEFIKRFNPIYSIRISSKNFGFENNIKSIPLYALFCLK